MGQKTDFTFFLTAVKKTVKENFSVTIFFTATDTLWKSDCGATGIWTRVSCVKGLGAANRPSSSSYWKYSESVYLNVRDWLKEVKKDFGTGQELNQEPRDLQSVALPTELSGPDDKSTSIHYT